jgi:hypothetical protein
MCGGYCEPVEDLSKDDRKAVLEEKKAILEAKLATVSHLIETLEKNKSKDSGD